jgi:hypothetical protein
MAGGPDVTKYIGYSCQLKDFSVSPIVYHGEVISKYLDICGINQASTIKVLAISSSYYFVNYFIEDPIGLSLVNLYSKGYLASLPSL